MVNNTRYQDSTLPYLTFDMICFFLYTEELSNLFNDFNLSKAPVQPLAVDLPARYKIEKNPVNCGLKWWTTKMLVWLNLFLIGDNKDFDVNFAFAELARF